MKTQYDVCVVGGGAAGMAAAIAAAEGGNTVCIIDKNKKLGKKVYATGNGRCNLAISMYPEFRRVISGISTRICAA